MIIHAQRIIMDIIILLETITVILTIIDPIKGTIIGIRMVSAQQ
jgi:hypothetical protein